MSIETIKECIMDNATLTSLEKRIFINYSMTKHSWKMEQIDSISTSALCNTFCATRCKIPRTICEKCYARVLLKMRKNLRDKLTVNHKFYTTYELTKKDVPTINAKIFRFESFGDIENELQVKNYVTIAKANKETFFVLWTKNPQVIAAAMEKHRIRKPKNFRIIASEYYINRSIIDHVWDRYRFIDKCFVVVTREYARENSIKPNCNGKCIDCMRCYDPDNNERIIIEYLK